jgi:hypothetical protein
MATLSSLQRPFFAALAFGQTKASPSRIENYTLV